MRSHWVSGLVLLALVGCGAPVGVVGGEASLLDGDHGSPVVGGPLVGVQPSVVVTSVVSAKEPVPGQVAGLPEDWAEPAEKEPGESFDAVVNEAAAEVVVTQRHAPYAGVWRSDARGTVLGSGVVASGPVYLTPRDFVWVLPGSPSVLPGFTPRPVDTSHLPVDAFVELGRLGRLRERVRGRMAWLVGYSFPKLTATVARSRLEAGQAIYLAPNGHHLNRDRAYAEVGTVGVIEGMLEQLRQAALERAQREAREANIRGRMAILPGFNRTFDVVKLLLWEWVVDDYRYGDQPVRRGLTASASWFEFDEVKRRVAIYWEDHPQCTAAELRLVAMRSVVEKIQDVQRSASSYAANPAAYRDMEAMPGLRDPRPLVNGDRTDNELDVAYNLRAIRGVCQTMPALLNSAVYP